MDGISLISSHKPLSAGRGGVGEEQWLRGESGKKGCPRTMPSLFCLRTKREWCEGRDGKGMPGTVVNSVLNWDGW